MDNIMKVFVDELNDNTLGLVYEGNFIFQFHDESLKLFQPVTGKLISTEVEYSPVSMPVKECTAFSEKNGRKDWLIEFTILARIHGSVYDETVDLDYENINTKVADFNGLRLVDTVAGKKYAFKTRPVKDAGYMFLGESKYTVLSVVMNVTELKTGFFGQDSVITLTSGATVYTPDVISFGKVSTRRYYQGDVKATATNDYNSPNGRVMAFTLTMNYTNETLLLDEVDGVASLIQKYTLTEVFNVSRTKSWTVTCEQASEVESVNGVKKLSLTFKEAL